MYKRRAINIALKKLAYITNVALKVERLVYYGHIVKYTFLQFVSCKNVSYKVSSMGRKQQKRNIKFL